jgi:hypothetical protein
MNLRGLLLATAFCVPLAPQNAIPSAMPGEVVPLPASAPPFGAIRRLTVDRNPAAAVPLDGGRAGVLIPLLPPGRYPVTAFTASGASPAGFVTVAPNPSRKFVVTGLPGNPVLQFSLPSFSPADLSPPPSGAARYKVFQAGEELGEVNAPSQEPRSENYFPDGGMRSEGSSAGAAAFVLPNKDGLSLVPVQPRAAAGNCPAPPVEAASSPHYTGPQSVRFDILILGDGFAKSDQAEFQAAAGRAWNRFRTSPPFSGFLTRFNVWTLELHAPHSGAESGSLFRIVFPSDRIVTTQCPLAPWQTAAQLGLSPQLVLLIVNHPEGKARGTGLTIPNLGSLAVVTNAADMESIVTHEAAHTIANLADEYAHPPGHPGHNDLPQYQNPPPFEPLRRNVTASYGFADIPPKWTPEEGGFHEGAANYYCYMWRSAPNCHMRERTHPAFCKVCQRELRRFLSTATFPQ